MNMKLQNIAGKFDPVIYNCIITTDEKGEWILLKSTPSVFDIDLFHSCEFEDNVGELSNKPDIKGVYSCEVIATEHIDYWGEHDTFFDISNFNLLYTI